MFSLALAFVAGFVAGANKDKSIALAKAAIAQVQKAFAPKA